MLSWYTYTEACEVWIDTLERELTIPTSIWTSMIKSILTTISLSLTQYASTPAETEDN